MKIIVASSGHKGFLSPKVSSKIIGDIIFKNLNLRPTIMPITDGGEGLIEIFVNYFGGKTKIIEVHDPLFRKRKAKVGLLKNDKTVVIEIAEAAGSSLLKDYEKQTMIATSYGVGEMIKKSYDYGCREFFVGLGGSIVSDCGLGLAQALGVEFYDKNKKIHRPIVGKGFNALSLELIKSFSLDKIKINLNEIDIKVASDSNILLTGEKGQAKTFGPQKNSTKEEINYLDRGYKNIHNIIYQQNKINVNVPYAGAGGGMGAGIIGFLGGKIFSGAKLVADELNFASLLKKSDLLIVSEGKLDITTDTNKAPYYFAKIAKKLNKKVICITGKKEIDLEVFDKVYHSCNEEIQLDKTKIIKNLEDQTSNFVKDIKKGIFDEKNK